MINYKNLGILIEATRCRRKYSVTYLLNSKNGLICDRHTYKKIRDGIVLKEIRIYDDLLIRLGFSNITTDLVIDFGELWFALDNYKVDDINLIFDKFKLNYNDFNQDIYIDCIFIILEMIHKFFILNKRLNEDDVSYLIDINKVFSKSMNNCILLLLGYNIMTTKNYSSDDILSLLLDSELISHRLRVFKFYLNNERYYEAMKMHIQIESDSKNFNIIQNLDFLDASSFMEERTNVIKGKYHYLFIESLAKLDVDFPSAKLIMYYGNIGIAALLKDQYDKSIEYFSKIKDYKSKRKMTIYIYLLFSYNQMNMKIPTSLMELEYSDYYSLEDKNLYLYFKEKCLRSNLENRDFILLISRTISLNSKVYIKLLETEMIQLCEQIRKYGDYHKFAKLMKIRNSEKLLKTYVNS